METKTEYAILQEQKHKRKIVLPCVIPWEYGSNKFATQKGLSFGKIRNVKVIYDGDTLNTSNTPVNVQTQEENNDQEDKKTEHVDNVPEKSNAPKFQNFNSQDNDSTNSDAYKAWIGGQITTVHNQ